MGRIYSSDGRDITSETLASVRKVYGLGDGATSLEDGMRLQKAATVSLANGLTAYDLEAPSKNLYPVRTPLRNRIPRVTKRTGAGEAAHWKAVTAITGGGVKSMGWVPEGQRAPRMSITSEDKSAPYVTLGEESDVTFEAESAASGFEDVLATSAMRGLQSLMIKEEYAILGGNRSVDLGTPTTPTLAAAGTGATLPAETYSVVVFGLTLEGYIAASLSDGIKRAASITGQDGKTFTLNGGTSKASAAATQAVTLGQALSASTPAIRGAVGYAWFVGLAGAERLEKITSLNSATFTAPLTGAGQTLASITDTTTDRSKNASLAYDGLLYSAFKSDSLAYYKAMATGTAGAGTALTASGDGSIVEIDDMLKAFWDNYAVSPEEIYVSSQELKSISKKVLTGSGTPLVRFSIDVANSDEKMIAGRVVGSYFNPFTMGGGQIIPIKLHPNLAPGTLFCWSENLPESYESANVPQTAVVQNRRDYYQINWAPITRANETGVYCETALKVYASFALGIIHNIGQ
jgi:hypothetical protein